MGFPSKHKKGVIKLLYKGRGEQANYGEAIGLLMPEGGVPFIPGDVGNASTYSFPVRFQRVKGLRIKHLFAHDKTKLALLLEAAKELVKEGVKAVTGCCGFMALFQQELANQLEVPVFLSSLLQVPFISRMLGDGEKVGILTANSQSLDVSLLAKVGVDSSIPLYIKGMESKENWYRTVVIEEGTLDSAQMEKELVASAEEMIQEEPRVKAILMECSMMPPYGAAVQEAVNLPIFDFVTMINYVYLAVVKKRFQGFM